MTLALPYAELHNHTFYSPLDGLSSPEEYCARAKEIGIDTLAITDHGILAGHRHFQKATRDAGIKSVLGVEAYISETDRFDRRDKKKRDDGTNVYNHIILLAKNDNGLKNINRLSEEAWGPGHYYKPRIDFDVLNEMGDDIIVLSGCMSGLISRSLEAGNIEQAENWAKKFKDRFGDDFYIEIQSPNPPELNHGLLRIADKFGIRPILTGDCHYANPQDRVYEDIFLILGTRGKPFKGFDINKASKMDLMDRLDYLYPKRGMSFKDIDVFLESPANRHLALSATGIDRIDVFENTLHAANKIEPYSFRQNEYTLPTFPEMDLNRELRRLVEKGMRARGLWGKQKYIDRMEEELAVIIEKNIAVYFVVLADALEYCRNNGIVYGAGRGSAAGSLVCYLLEITEVDPIEHNLLFWRFLDPERADMPDIDTDVQDSRRMEIKNYLTQKYGADRVASVTTYGTYKGRSAISAAIKVIGLPIKTADSVTKLLTEYVDKDATKKNLEEYRNHPALKDFRENNPDVIKIAEKLADRIKMYGVHAGGVVITDEPLINYTGVEMRQPSDKRLPRQNVTSIDGDECADLGLVKYDFLGLKNLSVVADAVEFVKQNHGRIIDFKHLPETDEKVFKMIDDGFTVGVFQAEADASTDVITKMGVDSFNDLVVSNALVRPGAMKAFGKEYIARKRGHKKTTYPTPESSEFLSDTFGFPLYQEQTMLICTEIAGMSKGNANKVRKLTAKKKDKSELLPFREEFMAGAQKQVSAVEAERLWETIETTAEYSFNKCLDETTRVNVRVEEDESVSYMNMTMQELYEYNYEFGNDHALYVEGPDKIVGDKVGQTVWQEVAGVYKNGVKPIVRVWLDESIYIDSTYLHKHRLSKYWKEAYRIHQNDIIWTNIGKRKVWKREFLAPAMTYDVELVSEPHAFYANNVLTHNSHAVAYSKLSYVTAYLKYHFPAEFMAALLNNESDAASVSQYLAECNRLGIEVKTPDINYSSIGYSCNQGIVYMGLANIKGIGDRKAQHIIANRPYQSYEDVLDVVKRQGSGVDTSVLKGLTAVGAMRFHDNKHLIDEQQIRENRFEWLGIPEFDAGKLSNAMKSRVTNLDEFDGSTVAIVGGIVTDITSKPNYTRVSIVDETGGASFFVNKDHGLEKGHKYLFVLNKASMIMCMDMADYDAEHPIVEELRRGKSPGIYAVAASTRLLPSGKRMGTLVYSHIGVLKSCTVWESDLDMAHEHFVLGERINIAVKKSKKPEYDDTLEGVKLYGK